MSKLTDGQKAVLKAFHDFAPMTDEVLAVWIHHFANLQMSSSGVRTRRSELSKEKLVEVVGEKRTRSRRAKVHGLTPAGEALATQLFG